MNSKSKLLRSHLILALKRVCFLLPLMVVLSTAGLLASEIELNAVKNLLFSHPMTFTNPNGSVVRVLKKYPGRCR